MNIKKLIMITLFLMSFTIFGQDKNLDTKVSQIKGIEYFDVYDPWEPMNRRIYYFNSQFDKYIFLPAVDLYKLITPLPVRKGVKNFFNNVENISTTGNSLLQFKLGKAMRAIGRFSINATLGIGGIFDVASSMGMPSPYEDFGLTLAHYGIGKGPYLVLPILGPSNLRDAFGSGLDTYFRGTTYHVSDFDELNSMPVSVIYSVDTRNNISFRYYQTGSPFEYEYIRFLYQKYRKLQSELGNEIF